MKTISFTKPIEAADDDDGRAGIWWHLSSPASSAVKLDSREKNYIHDVDEATLSHSLQR